jgi:hypothetical protein
MDKFQEMARRDARRAKARAQLAAMLDTAADAVEVPQRPYKRAYAARADGSVRSVVPTAFYSVKADY